MIQPSVCHHKKIVYSHTLYGSNFQSCDIFKHCSCNVNAEIFNAIGVYVQYSLASQPLNLKRKGICMATLCMVSGSTRSLPPPPLKISESAIPVHATDFRD